MGLSMSVFSRIRIPHVFTLLTGIVFLACLLTYVIPSGSYERQKRKIGTLERTVVIPGTYKTIPKKYSLG